MHLIQSFLGLSPTSRWMTLQRSPDSLASAEGLAASPQESFPALGPLSHLDFTLRIPTFYSMAAHMHEEGLRLYQHFPSFDNHKQ